MLILAEYPLRAGMRDEDGNPWGQANPQVLPPAGPCNAADQAAARSSFSAPRRTTLSSSSDNDRCSAFASSHAELECRLFRRCSLRPAAAMRQASSRPCPWPPASSARHSPQRWNGCCRQSASGSKRLGHPRSRGLAWCASRRRATQQAILRGLDAGQNGESVACASNETV